MAHEEEQPDEIFYDCIFKVEYDLWKPGSHKRRHSLNVLQSDASAAIREVENHLVANKGKNEFAIMGATLLARADF